LTLTCRNSQNLFLKKKFQLIFMSVRKANRVEITILTPKISGPFWRILGLKYVLIDIWASDQNEMMFLYFQL
jgi:hypothetical protein